MQILVTAHNIYPSKSLIMVNKKGRKTQYIYKRVLSIINKTYIKTWIRKVKQASLFIILMLSTFQE